MRKTMEIGGVVAAVVLIGFGIAAIVMGANGRTTVQNNLAEQKIVGTPDMTPTAIKAEATKAGLTNVTIPSCSVANQAVTNGTTARCFAQYMKIHALEATGGMLYSQMPRYATATARARMSNLWPSKKAPSRLKTRRETSGSRRPRCRRR